MTHEQIIQHASHLIALPTTSADVPALHQAIDYIAQLLVPYEDITVERFEQNNIPSLLAYYGKTRPETFDVILNGHIDVVPAQNPVQYVSHIKDGRLYGRGAYDMKLATVAMVDAFLQHGYNPARPVGLQVVADEETGGRNGILHQLQQGVRAKFTVIGEMTNLGICNETRGICWVEIGFKGTSAHGGYAWNGDNAISKASDFTTKLLQKFPVPKAQEWCTTANIAAISTGNATYNIVPDDAVVKVDFRFTPEDPHFADEAAVRTLVKSVHPDADILEFVTFEPAVFVPLENTHLKHFMRTFQNVTGETSPLIKRYAASDSRHMAAYGIAAIEFGISGADHHSQQEYADLASLQPFCDTLHAFLQSPLPSNTSPVSVEQIVTAA